MKMSASADEQNYTCRCGKNIGMHSASSCVIFSGIMTILLLFVPQYTKYDGNFLNTCNNMSLCVSKFHKYFFLKFTNIHKTEEQIRKHIITNIMFLDIIHCLVFI
jgi:hypothetical protein